MSDFNDIFNLNPDDYIEKNEKSENDFFKPDAKRGKENVYKALVRFLPFWKDPKNSKIKKYIYWLENPLTDEGFSVDCPSTIGQKSVLQDTFFKLKKSNSVAEQKLADKFKRQEKYFCLVQILKCDHEPELVGKIKILKFGQKINNIIQSDLQPEYGKAYHPFDPFTGRVMSLNVTLVANYNNYDNCKFVGEESPIIFNGKTLSKDPKVMEEFVEYLKNNSPDLDMCKYREWTDETRDKVKSIIQNTVPSMRTVEDIKTQVNKPEVKKEKTPQTKSENITIDSPKDEEIDINSLDLDLDNSSFDEDMFNGL